ncbi:hypothetical protein [Nonomuraea candida]|uniref:hypothetical protein n=1 Tax=Nonomuraea candida TaxID=359159 RepID=UPI0012F7D587|nr:hypothetical protein [Nonomuraea candida]
MSQVGRRLARKTSALGLASTLVLFVCSVLTLSSPAQAAAVVDKTMEVTYTCAAGGPFAAADVKVTISAPETVTPSGTAPIKWTLPAFTVSSSSPLTQGTQVVIEGNVVVGGGGTPTAFQAKHTGTVQAGGNTYTPSPTTMQANVTAPATGGPITVTPGTAASTPKGLRLTATPSGGPATTTECTFKSATPSTGLSIAVQAGGGNNTGDDVVMYECTLANSATDTNYPADVDIKVAMTTPTNATANADASITWTGTFETTGDPLMIPTGFPTTSPKLFATIKASGAGVPQTATGEAALPNVTVNQELTTLPSVTIKIKPTTTGTVTLTAGDLAFGASATSPFIKCTAATGTNPKQFTFTVTAGSTSPSASPSPTPTTTTPRPTTTRTSTVTVTPSSSPTRKSQTPKAGADTGAGGMMGPDGRLFILTGAGLIAAAAVGGLLMRRRSIKG